MAEELRRSLTAAQITPVLVTSYKSGIKDHAVLVGELAAAKADLVVFPGQLFEASMILDQADRAGARVATAIGADVLAADEPPARLLGAVDAFLVMLPWPGIGAEKAEAPIDATARRLAAAALEAWAAAAEDAGSVAAEAVNAALKGARATRMGPIRFDAKGDAVVPAFAPHVWASGRWQSRR
jgi:branched-chain amino acid transport system substrate-binding protein